MFKWGWLLVTLVSAPAWAAQTDLASKLSLRLSNGSLSNRGSSGGESINFGGLNIHYLKFVDPRVCWGFGYHMNFDFVNQFVPIHGFDFNLRGYFWGLGTRTTVQSAEISNSVRDDWALYGVAELSQQTYYLGSNPANMSGQEQTGNFFNLNTGLGVDRRVNRHWEFNAEGNFSLMTFAGTDDRVRISSMLVKVGVSYIW